MLTDINNSTFGLDISDRALRLAYLRKRGKKNILHSFNGARLKPGIIDMGIIKQPELVVKEITKLIKTVSGNKMPTRNVIAVLPERTTFIKVVTAELPTPEGKKKKDSEKRLEDAIKSEVKRHIPLEDEDTYFDSQILHQDDKTVKALVGAAPKQTVDTYMKVLDAAGLVTYALEIEAAPILRALLSENDPKSKMIIDFGAARTGLIAYAQNVVQFTVSLPTSGNAITELIMSSLQLDAAKAEKAKIVCGLDEQKCEGALRKILSDSITDLTTRIKRSISYYNRNFPDLEPISEIVLCGGGANFLKIDSVLSVNLKLPVRIGNPLTHVDIPKKINFTPAKALSYTTAIGLALRG